MIKLLREYKLIITSAILVMSGAFLQVAVSELITNNMSLLERLLKIAFLFFQLYIIQDIITKMHTYYRQLETVEKDV